MIDIINIREIIWLGNQLVEYPLYCPLSIKLTSIVCPHMVNGEMQLEEENCNQGSGTIGGLALTMTQTNLRPTQHPQYISSLYVDLSENFLMV